MLPPFCWQVLGFWSYYRNQCGYDADAMQEWVAQVRFLYTIA